MKEKDEPVHYLLVMTLETIREYLEELPFILDTQKPSIVTRIIFKQLVKELIKHQVDFHSIHVLEIADWEFQVTLNGRIKSKLLLKEKTSSDES